MTAAPQAQLPDLVAAGTFLSWLDPSARAFHFRVFDDDEARKDPKRARKFNGDFMKLGHILGGANADGCGVFVVANDGGQDAPSIKRVRVVFADLDGAPLDPVMACNLPPHLVVESSPGKFHAYWRVDDLPLDQFAGVQRAIAAEFNSDITVNDLPRVMRLPGFWHRKAEPFQSRIIHETCAAPLAAADVLARFPPLEATPVSQTAPSLDNVVEIGRHASILKETRMLAHDVASGHMLREEALDIMRGRVAAGRYSRHIPDDEILRALDGALRKESASPAHVKPVSDPMWGFTFADEMVRNMGPTRWLVQKLIPEDCTGVLYGPSGSLKSFLMIDIALSISHGTPWQGKPTKPRTVFYLAGEGEQGFAKRVAAWSAHNKAQPPTTFAFRQIPRLQDATQVDQLIETIRLIQDERGQAGLIVVDTLFTALDGGDENSGKDMGVMIAVLKRLRVEFGAAVFAVHHTGKVGETARGHSSLPSGMDVMVYAKPGPTPLTVEITNPKQKDGAEHPSMLLQALVHTLPIVGEDGEAETSLVLSNPTADILDGFKAKTKVTEETVAKAQNEKRAEDEAADRIKAFAIQRMRDGATLDTLEREVLDLSERLGFPRLARKKSSLWKWKSEAGL